MTNKTKPPRRLFRVRRAIKPLADYKQRFRSAMLDVVAEDLIASPCVVCARPADFVATWSPTAECIARDFDGDSTKSRVIFYRLCNRCARRCEGSNKQFIRTVEGEVLKLWRSGCVHRVNTT
jgi:hypothetical protein